MAETRKYSGSWVFYKKPDLYQGTLYIDDDSHAIRLEIIMPEDGKERAKAPYTGKIPFICGTLFTGAKILLYDCAVKKSRKNYLPYTKILVYASYAFWGLEVRQEQALRFQSAAFEFGEIIEWTGLCKFKWQSDEKNEYAVWLHKDPVKLQFRDDLVVEVKPQSTWSGYESYDTDLMLKQSVWFNFRYKKRVSWETIMEDVLSVRYMIGLGITEKPGIRQARYSHPSLNTQIKGVVLGSGLRITHSDVTIGIEEESHYIQKKKLDYLYRFDEISSPDRFETWCQVYPKLKPILDLYFAACMSENETDEMFFLNLVQALETFHARFITNKVKEYFRRVDELTAGYPKEEAEKWHTFLVDAGQQRNKNGIYLRSRLADLTFAEGDVLYLTLGEDIDLEEFLQKVIFTRNYYTHYDDTKLERSFVMEDIPYVNRILTGLLQYHILKLLGIGTEKLKKRMYGTVLSVNMDRTMREGVHEN